MFIYICYTQEKDKIAMRYCNFHDHSPAVFLWFCSFKMW